MKKFNHVAFVLGFFGTVSSQSAALLHAPMGAFDEIYRPMALTVKPKPQYVDRASGRLLEAARSR